MNITRYEKTIIPQTIFGRDFADEYEKRLREQCAFVGRSEDTQAIVIEAKYHFGIKEQNNGRST